jgi:uncharacterized OsmC-like protein
MKQLIKNSIRSFFCKQFCIELVLKVQIRCAAGSVPDGLQMTLKLEGNLTSQQKERLLQVSAKCPVKQMMLGKMRDGIDMKLAP